MCVRFEWSQSWFTHHPIHHLLSMYKLQKAGGCNRGLCTTHQQSFTVHEGLQLEWSCLQWCTLDNCAGHTPLHLTTVLAIPFLYCACQTFVRQQVQEVGLLEVLARIWIWNYFSRGPLLIPIEIIISAVGRYRYFRYYYYYIFMIKIRTLSQVKTSVMKPLDSYT